MCLSALLRWEWCVTSLITFLLSAVCAISSASVCVYMCD